MVHSSDTVAALATPAGTSAIAVLRASGPDCSRLATEILGVAPTPRLAHRADYREMSGKLLDDVLITFFLGPNSYTGEDTLEISSHGNPFIAQKILEDLFARGCRSAEPGEFTRRAFLNGRLDLSQAEAVMDLISARSERALDAANQQLRGSLGRLLGEISDELLGVLSRVEAYIDFPEEDLPDEDRGIVRRALERIANGTNRLLATQHYGEILRDGIRTVIVGEPNAGKSSLLNRLVGQERALVSEEPGTTRDFIEERILIGEHCFRFVDTAGLNPSPAPLEKRGMEKTMERAAEADLLLWVLDGSRPTPVLPPEILRRMSPANTLLVLNKMDLGTPAFDSQAVPFKSVIRLSALTGEGMETLIEAVTRHAESFRTLQGNETIVINARHADALARARSCLAEAQKKLDAGGLGELVASDLRGALDAFGEVAGKFDNERMLDRLFATFCIGK